MSVNSLIPPSGKYCLHCNLTVANGDPDGENVPGDGEKRQHKSCADAKRLAVAQSKNTELCEVANI
jgi:hypothetical protein